MNSEKHSLILEASKLRITYKKWGKGKETIIALHGWLDNSASFDPMASFLSEDFTFYALDLIGHGHSEHLPHSANYTLAGSVEFLLDFAKTMNLDSFHLMGHSLGAGIAVLTAGVIPKRIKTLSLIEGVGPIASPKEEFPDRFLKHFKIKFRKLLTEKPLYKTKEEAALDRHKKSGLPLEASRLLAERGLENTEEGSFTWRTDPRLLAPTAHPFTEEEVHVFLKRITAPTKIILGSTSWLAEYKALEERIKAFKKASIITLEGGHHVHMERPEETFCSLYKETL